MRQAIAIVIAFLSVATTSSQDAGKPLLQVLTETGQVRDGLPVLAPHPDNDRIVRELSRGFVSGIIRLYRCVQAYIEPRQAPEPAYLLLSCLWRIAGFRSNPLCFLFLLQC